MAILSLGHRSRESCLGVARPLAVRETVDPAVDPGCPAEHEHLDVRPNGYVALASELPRAIHARLRDGAHIGMITKCLVERAGVALGDDRPAERLPVDRAPARMGEETG